MKIIIKQTQLAYVDWFYEIEADGEREAIELVNQGEADSALGFWVGDSYGFSDSEETRINENDFGFQNMHKLLRS